MKKRIIALLLLLVIALTACSSASTAKVTEAPTENTTPAKPTEATAAPATTEALTEAPTETPTEAPTEAPVQYPTDVDLGSLDGSTYKNETIGISCTLPDGWYIYNQTDLAALNNLVESVYNNNDAIINAIENGQTAIFFCASHPTSISSVNINASKNSMPGMDENSILVLSSSQVKAQMEQTGMMQNIVCEIDEVTFCGEKHSALSISCETNGIQLFETILCLARGDYLYTLTVSSAQESTMTEILNLFEPVG